LTDLGEFRRKKRAISKLAIIHNKANFRIKILFQTQNNYISIFGEFLRQILPGIKKRCKFNMFCRF